MLWPVLFLQKAPSPIEIIRGNRHIAVASLEECSKKVKSGDRVVLQPGNYYGTLKTENDNVRIEAAAPGVRWQGDKKFDTSQLRPSAEQKGVYTLDLKGSIQNPGEFKLPMMWLDNDFLMTLDRPINPEKDRFAYYLKGNTVEVIFDGKSLPKGSLRVPIIRNLIYAYKCKNLTVRGIEFSGSGGTAVVNRDGMNCRIEYNSVHDCGGAGIISSNHGYIARNTIARCGGNGIHVADAKIAGGIVEENVVASSGGNYSASKLGYEWQDVGGYEGAIKLNYSRNTLIQHNFCMEDLDLGKHYPDDTWDARRTRSGMGLWQDIECYNNTWESNSVSRVGYFGIFFELQANRSIARLNVVQDSGCGLVIRSTQNCLFSRNWVFTNDMKDHNELNPASYSKPPLSRWKGPDENSQWGRMSYSGIGIIDRAVDFTDEAKSLPVLENAFIDNLIQVGGYSIMAPTDKAPWPNGNGLALTEHPRSNVIDRNIYSKSFAQGESDGKFSRLGDLTPLTLEEHRKASGWDLSSKEVARTIGSSVLGMASLNIYPAIALPGAKPHKVMYDPGLEHSSTTSMYQPLLWRGNSVAPEWEPEARTWWFRNTNKRKYARSGDWCIGFQGGTTRGGKPVTEDQVWETVMFPVRDDSMMTTDFWMKGEDFKPVQASGALSMTWDFFDEFGFSLGSKAVSPSRGGSFDWTRVENSMNVPKGARWAKLRFRTGVCTGLMLFDDIQLNTGTESALGN
jgi:hypothetical protein